MSDRAPDRDPGVELLWIPLGAGSPLVIASGRAFEAVSAWRHHRPRRALYHSALTVRVPEGAYAIEQTPVPRGDPASRGVVAGGPVGFARAGRLRVFRYEVRCWKDGEIPDIAAAVGDPIVVTRDPVVARRVLAVVATVPNLVWGRDPGRVGDMWNSNSVVAWTLATAGVDGGAITPPIGGRAPGWQAGVLLAGRSCAEAD